MSNNQSSNLSGMNTGLPMNPPSIFGGPYQMSMGNQSIGDAINPAMGVPVSGILNPSATYVDPEDQAMELSVPGSFDTANMDIDPENQDFGSPMQTEDDAGHDQENQVLGNPVQPRANTFGGNGRNGTRMPLGTLSANQFPGYFTGPSAPGQPQRLACAPMAAENAHQDDVEPMFADEVFQQTLGQQTLGQESPTEGSRVATYVPEDDVFIDRFINPFLEPFPSPMTHYPEKNTFLWSMPDAATAHGLNPIMMPLNPIMMPMDPTTLQIPMPSIPFYTLPIMEGLRGPTKAVVEEY
jgi:hypothetical protein